MRVTYLTALVIWLGLFATLELHGQEAVGSLTGVVHDPSGAVVTNAEIAAKERSTGVETKESSDSRGIYTFSRLAPGDYTVTVAVTGFKTAEYSGIRVISARVVSLDVQLQVGTTSETTTVVAEATTVDVTRSDTGTTRVYEEVGELPINGNGTGRAAMDFLRTLPGVNYGISGNLGGASSLSQGAVFGVGQATGVSPTTYNVDGVNAAANLGATTGDNVGIMPETIEEFRLATNVNAEYGANLGNVISLVTKSGTNDFHGETTFYIRNEALNAINWLHTNRDRFREKDWNFNVGGPIIKNKTFFFAAFDLYRFAVPSGTEPGGAHAIESVPTALMRTGDFSEWLGPQTGTDALGRPIFQGEIYDPATTRSDGMGGFIRDPFMFNGNLNVIDPARFSEISSFFQDTYPLPNRPGFSQNGFYDPQTFGRNTQRLDFKVDHYMGNTRLSGGANILFKYKQYGACVNSFVKNPADFLSCVDYTPSNKKYRVSLTHTFNPNTVLDFMVGFNNNVQVLSTAGKGFTYGEQSGLQGLLSPNIPFIFVSGFSPQGYPIHESHSTISGVPISASLSRVKGSHTLKFGLDYFRQVNTSNNDSGTAGTWSFGTSETGLPNQPQTGNSWASFLLGDVDSVSMNVPSQLRYSSSQWGFFAQDQWRVTNKLTLNYGLRWDLGLAPIEEKTRMASFDPTLVNPAAGGLLGAVTFYGSGGGRNGKDRAENNYFGAWGPRIGVAYQLLPKTVLRGYYGLVYTPVAADPQPPTYGAFSSVSLATQNGGLTPALNWEGGFPDDAIPPAIIDPTILNNTSVTYIDPKANRAARSHNVGFSLEQQVAANFLLRAEYVGKITHGILFPIEINQIPLNDISLGNTLFADINSPEAQAAGITPPYPGFSGSVAQALRPYPQYTSVNYANNRSGFSNYHALLLTAQKHFGAGLSVLAGYTFSKLTGSATPQHTDQGLANSVFWGNLGIDRRHNLNLSWVYELPFGPGKKFLNSGNAFNRYVIGGWEISAIHNYQSGAPIVVNGNSSIPGVGAVWVNQVPNVDVRSSVSCGDYDPFSSDPARSHLLNRAAFSDPAPFTFGRTRLANVTDCAEKTEQISFRKNLPFGERFKTQIGADFFNAFNRHTPYFWPFMVLNVDSPDFGKTTVGTSARTIQLFAKISF